jgi:mannose-1-phosphate guanylyltransferase/mannose-6-phosphate isomerase
MIVPVILAGGSGSRLWPLSRSTYPKQLLPLVSKLTMLQDTLLRIQSVPNMAAPIVVCNQEHRFLVAEQLKQIGIEDAVIILEPLGKNTAPAAAIAALYVSQQSSHQTMLILPADHIIQNTTALAAAITYAEINAQAGQLVTFGVTPTRPETGYGYIKARVDPNNNHAYKVLQFIEKPDQAMAKTYLASGQYYWNSGIFLFQTACFLAELQLYAPDILKTCQQTMGAMSKDLDFCRLDPTIFAACPSNSIDYAVMEKTKNAALVPLDAQWSDVGSWSALWEVLPADSNGNIVVGDIITQDVSNSYLRAESRMVAVLGVTDHIIVETPDAVLVAHKDYSQAVKEIVNRLKQQERIETDLHHRVYRPWGYYETLDKSSCFQVKHITVKPGATLSLQMHKHRSEHWVVVEGVAEVTRGEDTFTIKANESTYIPQGVKHRLANRSTHNLKIIEVQSGSYLGEDDIVRFEDIYGRVGLPA